LIESVSDCLERRWKDIEEDALALCLILTSLRHLDGDKGITPFMLVTHYVYAQFMVIAF
jgi:hypothetical protein